MFLSFSFHVRLTQNLIMIDQQLTNLYLLQTFYSFLILSIPKPILNHQNLDMNLNFIIFCIKLFISKIFVFKPIYLRSYS